MKVVILGASGRTGKVLVEQALKKGHEVVGVVKSFECQATDPRLSYVIGDATNIEILKTATVNADAIVSVLGGSNTTLMQDAVRAIIGALKDTTTRRVVIMSSLLVKQEMLTDATKVATQGMQSSIQDKIESEKMLRSTYLDWTIIYPTFLNDNNADVSAKVLSKDAMLGLENSISRGAVSTFIINELEEPHYVKGEVIITQT